MNDSTPILFAVNQHVATITLNRPAAKNALNEAALKSLTERLIEAQQDPEIWVVVIRAAGNDFCVGQDVKELSGSTRKGDYFEPVFRALKALYKPVICLVQGLCLAGGAGIAMGSDIRILSRSARMGWPHTKIGLCSIGGPSTLARAIPVNLALELMYTGDLIGAERALQLGLANHVEDDDRLDAKLTEIQDKILRNAPLAIRAAKQATLSTLDLDHSDAIAQAHAILDELIDTADAKEGMRAFVEKRAPLWKAC